MPTSAPTDTPTAAPTPAPPVIIEIPPSELGRYEDHIANADGSIRIEYFFIPEPGEKQRDLARAQRVVDFLEELYGRRPQPIVYEMLGRIRDSSRTWTRFRPTVTVQFEFQSDGLQAHELAHLFTHMLLPTEQWWFNEGISNRADEMYTGQKTCLSPQTALALQRLRNGENVFYDYPERVEICVAHWLNVHQTGDLFFEGLKEYGLNPTRFRELLRALDRLAESGDDIGIEQIKQATYEVLGSDVSPLLELLEPGIVYDDVVRYDEDLERVGEFFERHPEYATPHVSWVD